MRPTAKFLLSSGASGLIGLGASVVLSFASAKLRNADALVLFAGIAYATPIVFTAYLASKRLWVPESITIGRALLSILPLALLPFALLFSFIGWGDPQEHLIRGILHGVHRALPTKLVGTIVFGIGLSVAALLVAILVWLAVSILTRSFRVRSLALFSVSALIPAVCASFAVSLVFRSDRSNTVATIIGIATLVCFGVLFATAVTINGVRLRAARSIIPLAGVLLCLVGGGGLYLFSKSSAETQLPISSAPPLWTLDLAGAGCRPAYGRPTANEALNEIAFATDGVLGMAFPTDPMPQPGGGWKYASCMLSIDAATGKAIAHQELPFAQLSISGRDDGNLTITSADGWVLYSPELKEIGDSKNNSDAAGSESGTGPDATNLLKHFIYNESDSSLWFQDEQGDRRIAQNVCGGMPRALSDDRVLITACTRFLVFDGRGNLVGSQEFVRPEVNFAALSRDHRRFALAIFVWGFGDPSYLEEETIAVYDVATERPIFAVKSDPLPDQQSWVALSPDASFMAVGAEHTLRLFRLPPEAAANTNP
jgi:hypothetical protein